MTALERVLIPVAALFLALAVAACIYQAMTAAPFAVNGHPPFTVVLAQLAMRVAPALSTIALACIAGLVFAHAVRWRRSRR
ncbi:hypothetical protein [Leifsonia sp. Root112D2]|uniref:hypothetical protein n=1 Tax=Leifsonia sp. Root112D2 TaxID=1736426 RepID=UPI0006FC2A91|nr:hypothetical protein [Leifsonia sp. Root112D2]KQV06480.1 hypothetical protein ASC63_03340 [Leifsonia sp. Root112D2]